MAEAKSRQALMLLRPANNYYLKKNDKLILKFIRDFFAYKKISLIRINIESDSIKIIFEAGKERLDVLLDQLKDASNNFFHLCYPEMDSAYFWSEGKVLSSDLPVKAKCLVIGGAGYIGSHVVKDLLKSDFIPVVFDNLSTGHKENILPGVEFIKGDIKNYHQIREAMIGVESVIYLAAYKAAGESMLKPEKYSINNIGGAINILNAMTEAGVKNIIFSSTAAVYGEPKYLPIDESHPTEPINYYGYTKLEIERLIKWYSQLKGINYFVLRYFNAVGYDADGDLSGLEQQPNNLLPILMEAAIGLRQEVQVFGNDYNTKDGSCVRDYIHVTDLATAHLKALEKLSNEGVSDIVNLGTSLGITVFELIDEVKRITGIDFKVNLATRRLGDPEIILADYKKANEVLGWSPKFSDLATIVKTTWSAYCKNYKLTIK